jgi:DnaK suppressor protein
MQSAQSRLTNEQLEELRRRLEGERRRILRLLEAPAPALADDEQTEFEESAQRATERTQQLGIAERERELLAEIERALTKMRAGTYGVSEETGDPIPYERLAVMPWARRGVDE